jgi:hypothetical protein
MPGRGAEGPKKSMPRNQSLMKAAKQPSLAKVMKRTATKKKKKK